MGDNRCVPSDAAAPGWATIDQALATVYGDTEPTCHWATVRRWSDGGPDPLDGISVYARDDHWHYVSYGLTELYTKRNEDLQASGRGFELTARLRRGAEAEPPMFMANVLQNLARYVFETDNVLAPGHSMDLFGPILEGSDTQIRAVIFYEDPELRPIYGPFGHVRFVQVVGVTQDERAAIRTWDAKAMRPVLSRHLPLLVTDLDRRSLLTDPDVDQAIIDGRNRDGSSLGALQISALTVRAAKRLPRRPAVVTLPATVVDSLCLVLPLRIGFGRPFALMTKEKMLTIVPGPDADLTRSDSGWTLALTAEQAESVGASLRPVAGRYEAPGLPDIAFQVERTAVLDQQGNVISHVG